MEESMQETFAFPDEEGIAEFEQAVDSLTHMLSFTKQYYRNIDQAEIDLLIDMIERAKKSLDTDSFISENDFIKMHMLIETYDNDNRSLPNQLLGAYYLRILAGDSRICLHLLHKIVKGNSRINEDVLEFFTQLCVCLKIMASYEAIQQENTVMPLPWHMIQE